MEEYLNCFKGVVLFVIYDCYFFDWVINYMVEFDWGLVYWYVGNYEKFMEFKVIWMENEVCEFEKNKNFYCKELVWMCCGF